MGNRPYRINLTRDKDMRTFLNTVAWVIVGLLLVALFVVLQMYRSDITQSNGTISSQKEFIDSIRAEYYNLAVEYEILEVEFERQQIGKQDSCLNKTNKEYDKKIQDIRNWHNAGGSEHLP